MTPPNKASRGEQGCNNAPWMEDCPECVRDAMQRGMSLDKYWREVRPSLPGHHGVPVVDACRKCGAKRGEPCAGNWTTCEGSAAHLERNAGVEASHERQCECMDCALARGVGASQPLNGIPATWTHDEGAYAQCGECGRYTLNPNALTDRPPPCDCGSKHGWSGSFKRPGPDAKWSGLLQPALGVTPCDGAQRQEGGSA